MAANTLALDANGQLSANTQKLLQLNQSKDVIIVDFFASWCVSCRVEIPLLAKLNATLDQSKVEIIGVDVDEDVKAREKFLASMREKGMNFRVVNDPEQKIISEFSPVGMPALYYVVKGKVIGARIGAIEHIDQVVKSDLQELGVN